MRADAKAAGLTLGYAMSISQVRTGLVAARFDPSIGLDHRRAWNPIPLVYDLMEPLRPIVDCKILEFTLAHTFTPRGFHNHPKSRIQAKSAGGEICGQAY